MNKTPDPTQPPAMHLFTVAELAHRLGISTTTVYRLVEARDIDFYRISGSIRFSDADVLAYLKRRRVGAANRQHQ